MDEQVGLQSVSFFGIPEAMFEKEGGAGGFDETVENLVPGHDPSCSVIKHGKPLCHGNPKNQVSIQRDVQDWNWVRDLQIRVLIHSLEDRMEEDEELRSKCKTAISVLKDVPAFSFFLL